MIQPDDDRLHVGDSNPDCMTTPSTSVLSQRDARALVLHLLYAMEAFDYETSLESIVDNLNRGFGLAIQTNEPLFQKAQSIITERKLIDEEIKPLLSNWRLERLGCTTHLILRLAIWELKHTDMSPSIVINEAIELAKCFSEYDAYRFVNGVLDSWLSQHQPERRIDTETKEVA